MSLRSLPLNKRPEFGHKPKPLTCPATCTLLDAVAAMSERNYGCIIVTDADFVVGVLTERDVMKRVVNEGRDPATTLVSEVMTSNPRVASEGDDLLDWLRIMSNERFRRLPVVDAEGKLTAVFTQGDFVSYTWPDLMYQAKELARGSLNDGFPWLVIGGALAAYTFMMALIFKLL